MVLMVARCLAMCMAKVWYPPASSGEFGHPFPYLEVGISRADWT